jgi:hypothetical protein
MFFKHKIQDPVSFIQTKLHFLAIAKELAPGGRNRS